MAASASAFAKASADREALLLFVPVASDAAASSGARASARRPRLARSKDDGGNMRVLTIEELMRLTRIELIGVLVGIKAALPDYAEGTTERENALTSLRNIRAEQLRRDLSP
jgi:hypothetical protein